MSKLNARAMYFAIGALVLAYWSPVLAAGYAFEDSWFLEYRNVSLGDLLVWFTEPRDILGYYRPVRNIFFAIPAQFFLLPPPELYHGLLLGVFLSVLFFLYRFYFSLLESEKASLVAVFAYALCACHLKPLVWLSASHNVFAVLFCSMALFFQLRSQRLLTVACFILAISSRETSVGLVLALGWLAYIQAPAPFDWKAIWLRSWELWGVAFAFSVFFLWQPPQVVSDTGLGDTNLPLWLAHWLGYLFVFVRPTTDSFQATVLTASTITVTLAIVFSLLCAWGFMLQVRKREPVAVFGWIWLGGLGVHLVFVDRWHQEYAVLAGMGFFGFCASWLLKIAKGSRRRENFIFAIALVCIGWIALANRSELYEWQKPWALTQAWGQSFADFQKTIAAGDVIVVTQSESFQGSERQKSSLVFLPQYIRLRFPERIVYWDTSRLPWAALAYGLGHRHLGSTETRAHLMGQAVVFAREENFQWSIIRREVVTSPESINENSEAP